jgi:hypothetical protein
MFALMSASMAAALAARQACGSGMKRDGMMSCFSLFQWNVNEESGMKSEE